LEDKRRLKKHLNEDENGKLGVIASKLMTFQLMQCEKEVFCKENNKYSLRCLSNRDFNLSGG
jgi:hypothetical protein